MEYFVNLTRLVTELEKHIEGNTPIIRYDGFDEAIVGFGQQFHTPVIVYCYERMIACWVENIDYDEDDGNPPRLRAIEDIDFNYRGSYNGKTTPIILDVCGCDICSELDGVSFEGVD